MTGLEIAAEVEWFLECRVHPLMIAETLDRKIQSLQKTCEANGRRDLAEALMKENWVEERKVA